MASKSAPLVFHCKTPAGWKRLPVATYDNGKLRAHYAMVGGEPVEYPEGHYELRCSVNGKRVWRNVGDARNTMAEQKQLARHLVTKTAASASAGTVVESPERVNLRTKSSIFIARQITRGKKRHAQRATRELAEFLDITGVTYADQLTEAAVLD
jgi:hypothetical protein